MLFILSFLLFGINVVSQEIEVNLFYSFEEMLENVPTRKITLIPKEIDSKHIRVKKFTSVIDKDDRKLVRTSFGMEYNGVYYFNLENSEDHYLPFSFVRIDFIRNFCIIYIDEDTPKAIRNAGGMYFGLAASIGAESRKWGKHWYNSENEKVRILFVDPKREKFKGRLIANLLTKKEFQFYFAKSKSEKAIKEMTFEQVSETIEKEELNKSF